MSPYKPHYKPQQSSTSSTVFWVMTRQLEILFHLKPSSNDLAAKIFDLGKKTNVLPVSALSAAYVPETE
jgi:hypothetical protein